MATKARLEKLNERLNEEPKAEQKTTNQSHEIEAHAPRGERAEYLKISVTMSADMLGALKQLGVKRKAKGEKDTDISSLLREAAADLIGREGIR